MLMDNATIHRLSSVSATQVDNDVIMLDMEQGKYFGLNEVGSIVWQYIEAPRSFEDIIQHLMNQFNVDEKTCRQETEVLIEKLKKANLVSIK